MIRNKYKKTAVLILCAVAVLFILNSCSKKTPAPDSEDETSASSSEPLVKEIPAPDSEGETAASSSEPLIIEPGVGVGSIKLGISKDEVIKHFGAPDEIKTFAGGIVRLNYISSKGINFGLEPKFGLNYIYCYSNEDPHYSHRITNFPNMTKEGLAMGSSRDQIITTYSTPDSEALKGDYTILYYYDLNTEGVDTEMVLLKNRLIGIRMKMMGPGFVRSPR